MTQALDISDGISRHRSTTDRCRAFTLFELIVVLTIISVISVVTVTRFGGSVAKSRLDAAAARLESDIRLVRSAARATGTTHKLGFDVGGDRYDAGPRPGTTWTAAIDLSDAPYYTGISRVNFNDTTVVNFDAFGSPDESGWIVLTLGDIGVVVSVTESGQQVATVGAADATYGWESVTEPDPVDDPVPATADSNAGLQSESTSDDMVRTARTSETTSVSAMARVRSD